ncbi:xyloglucan endotransglucosylase protein 7-like isoform X2 [Henckelia pumila]|uniref:xyloglucan endotransglucosylase protein 7-like isoform X2 n=1 Tax=Henckelia pumila TaxID=405737 RepID=UPI003C6E5B38
MQPRNYSHFSRSKKLLPFLAFIILFAIFVFKADIIAPLKLSAARGGQQITSHENDTILIHERLAATEGDRRAKILEDGETTVHALSLDKTSGSGFESKEEFLFGKIGMKIKLPPTDAAATVSTYYMSSEGEQQDRIEVEFIGNSTGDPYTLHTNVFVRGKGEREQRFFLWFDPTRDFHNYTIVWNPKCIIFYVDDIPIREFKNLEEFGVPFPNAQPMRIYLSVGTDGDSAPSTTAANSYSNFSADACVWSQGNTSSCDSTDFSSKTWLNMELDVRNHVRMQRIQKSYKKYDYCWDKARFPDGPGPECGIYY